MDLAMALNDVRFTPAEQTSLSANFRSGKCTNPLAVALSRHSPLACFDHRSSSHLVTRTLGTRAGGRGLEVVP
jgi:hypothetical protein